MNSREMYKKTFTEEEESRVADLTKILSIADAIDVLVAGLLSHGFHVDGSFLPRIVESATPVITEYFLYHSQENPLSPKDLTDKLANDLIALAREQDDPDWALDVIERHLTKG